LRELAAAPAGSTNRVTIEYLPETALEIEVSM
jgi:hypothetical protein